VKYIHLVINLLRILYSIVHYVVRRRDKRLRNPILFEATGKLNRSKSQYIRVKLRVLQSSVCLEEEIQGPSTISP
jgi:hypothetical protein